MVDRSFLIEELKDFLDIVEEYEDSKNELEKLDIDLNRLIDNRNQLINQFDEEYQEKYIRNKIGTPPKDFVKIDPRNFIKSFKNKKSTEIETYNNNRENLIKKYYVEFSDDRTEIIEKSRKDFDKKFVELESRKRQLVIRIENLDTKINDNNLLPVNLVNSYSMKKIITYLEDWRADSIKGAISIFYIEEKLEIALQKIESRFSNLEQEINHLTASKDEIDEKVNYIISSIDDLNQNISNL